MGIHTCIHNIMGDEVFCTPVLSLLSFFFMLCEPGVSQQSGNKREGKYHKTCMPLHGWEES